MGEFLFYKEVLDPFFKKEESSNVICTRKASGETKSVTIKASMLEELLGNFDGTVLLVTHDRQFLDNVTTSYIVFEGDGNLREFVGDYDAWRKEHLSEAAAKSTLPKAEKPKAEVSAEPVPPKNPPSKKKLSYKETRELEALPQQIEDLENEQKTLAEKLNDPDFYRDPVAVQSTNARLAEIDEALLIALERWEELESRKGA